MTVSQLKAIIDGSTNGGHTMAGLITYHNEKEGDLLEWGTMKNYMTTQKYLMSFITKQYGLSDFEVADLNFVTITGSQSISDFRTFDYGCSTFDHRLAVFKINAISIPKTIKPHL